jgi:hypothetical protein
VNAIEGWPGDPEQVLDVDVSLTDAGRPAGDVVLVSRGPAPARVWRMGNSWGDETVSFEISSGGDMAVVKRKPQVYTRNVPSSFEIPPGGRHAFPFDLSDGAWRTEAALGLLEAGDVRLVAVYELVPDHEAVEQGCWTGRIRSEPVPLHDRL